MAQEQAAREEMDALHDLGASITGTLNTIERHGHLALGSDGQAMLCEALKTAAILAYDELRAREAQS